MATVVEVSTSEQIRLFLDLPKRLFARHPKFISPLDSDIENIFNPAKNPLFQTGEAIRWIVQDDTGITIGRMAAFIDGRTVHTFDCPTGGIGFFDCIEDANIANMLFEIGRDWLKRQDIEAMIGPINFGENYRFWGLCCTSESPPVFGHFYHPAYYAGLFEQYGFKPYFNQVFLKANIRDFQFVEQIIPGYNKLMEDKRYSCRHLGQVGDAHFTEAFCTVYNQAWAVHQHFTPMKKERFEALLVKLKSIIDPELFWVAYCAEQPIGVYLMLRDLNPFLQRYNDGSMPFWRKILLKWWLLRGGCRRIYAMAFGIVPEFQHLGVGHLLMIASARTIIPQRKYDTLEIAWIGDFNPRMQRLMSLLVTKQERTYTTFRYVFK
jgi:hypothetical protein